MRPFAAFVGLRYLRTHRSNSFVSFITFASVAGVALGVAALIVVLSVMNGFEAELRERLVGMTSHVTLLPEDAAADREALLDALRSQRAVVAASPYLELEGMISRGTELAGAIITGVDPASESGVSAIGEHLLAGTLDDLEPGSGAIILGRSLALKLGVRLGDAVTLLVPRQDPRQGLVSGMRRFTVAGVFELGIKDHDGARALVHVADAGVLAGRPGEITGIRVRTRDLFAAPGEIRAWVEQRAAAGEPMPRVRDWTQDNATYFRAIRIEKAAMMLLLLLIVAVAAFNIVATLVMVVTDKRPGVAILRTLGYARRTVVSIFVFQGIVIGWVGVIAGVLLGVGVALNVGTLAPRLEALLGFEFMPADVYYVTSLPVEVHGSEVALIALAALMVTALATVYPALRAAAVPPGEVLRYE